MNRYDPFSVAEHFADENWERPQVCGGDGGNCIEVNMSREGHVGVRDSKLATSPVLVFTSTEWELFLTAARRGQYDP